MLLLWSCSDQVSSKSGSWGSWHVSTVTWGFVSKHSVLFRAREREDNVGLLADNKFDLSLC